MSRPEYDSNFVHSVERRVKITVDFNKWFSSRNASVLLLDAEGVFPLVDYKQQGCRILYINLLHCVKGEFLSLAKHLSERIVDGECAYDGIIIDNADKISTCPRNQERECFEEFIVHAMKRDDDYRMTHDSPTIPFASLMIAVRCGKFPDFLMGKSMQWFLIDTADRELY